MTGADRGSEQSDRPSVSIVIPTQNAAALLSECLQAVQRIDFPADLLEVVIVDNASTDRTRELLARRYPSVRVLPLDTNLGFAAACNKGADFASGKYLAFLNNDALPDQQWLNELLAGLDAGPEGTVCVASRIVSRDGREVEYDGAGSNLFAAGRPHSTWGWPDLPEPPGPGSPVLFASGGAMLIHRETFIDAGGFDHEYFAYFEDVDLGWRLWLLGHAVVYAPGAVVRHIGGATGRRAGAHKRYTLWESNSLATIIKNYETGNMERILSAALLLEYKRALLSAGEAINPREYELTASKDANRANVERLPKVSVAHLAAIDRLNAMLPHLIRERARLQALRQRPDREILPLLGRLYAPQFAGREYASAANRLADALGLFALTDPAVPPRVLIVTPDEAQAEAAGVAAGLATHAAVAIAVVGSGGTLPQSPAYSSHVAAQAGSELGHLLTGADVVLACGSAAQLDAVRNATSPIAVLASVGSADGFPVLNPHDIEEVLAFCVRRGVA